MNNAYLGVDWGTHSSKWIFQDTNHTVVIGRIWNSTVWRLGDSLGMYPVSSHFTSSAGSASELKRKVINDPDQAFWEGQRAKIDASLAEAVVFSLLTLLLDAKDALEEKGISLAAYDQVTVRFSHPNWISPDSVMALQYYRDAAAITSGVIATGFPHSRHDNGIQIKYDQLQQFITENRSVVQNLQVFPPIYDYVSYASATSGVRNKIQWSMVFESCAAGFPYLIEGEPIDGDEFDTSAAKKFRKLLVIDIGAGSTDAGYMLRTITIEPRTGKPAGMALLWLPASAALEKAGNWLTDQVHQHWAQQGLQFTKDEAESHKVSAAMKWSDFPFVKEWCEAIADHIGNYIHGVSDNERLPKEPPLEIVLTGGSSVVEPLKPFLAQGVRDALGKRGITNVNVLNGTKFVELPGAPFLEGFSNVELAQMAVCLGASDPRLSKLKHYEKLP